MHDQIFGLKNIEPAHYAQCPSHRQEADPPTTRPAPVRNQRNPSRLVTCVCECITHTSFMTMWGMWVREIYLRSMTIRGLWGDLNVSGVAITSRNSAFMIAQLITQNTSMAADKSTSGGF